MTTRRPSTPAPRPERSSILSTLLVAALVLSLVGTATAAAPPTLSSDDVVLAPGETDRAAVTLSSAPDGVSGFNLTVGVDDPSTATADGASVGDDFELSEVTVADDGSRVTLVGVDVGETVQSSDEAVTLATIDLEGLEGGETSLVFEAVDIESDGGDAVDPSLEGGTVSVSDSGSAEGGASSGTAASDAVASDGTDEGADSSDESTAAGGDRDATSEFDDSDGAGADDATGDSDGSNDDSGAEQVDDADATEESADASAADGGDDSLSMPWIAATVLATLAVAVGAARSARRR